MTAYPLKLKWRALELSLTNSFCYTDILILKLMYPIAKKLTRMGLEEQGVNWVVGNTTEMRPAITEVPS